MKINPIAFAAGFAATSLLMLSPSVLGQTGPSGSFTNTITAPANAVWDLAGVVTNDNVNVTAKDGINIAFSFPVSIQQNGAGRLKGAGDVTVASRFEGIASDFTGSYKISGALSSSRAGSRLRLNGSAHGNAEILGKMRRVTAKDRYVAVVNATALTVSGRHVVALSAAGRSLVSNESFGPESLTVLGALGNGSWTLTLSLSSDGAHVTGTGAVLLNSGQGFNYNINGRFNSKKNSSTLVLTGHDLNTKGSVLTVKMSGDTVTSIKGRISGQSVNATF